MKALAGLAVIVLLTIGSSPSRADVGTVTVSYRVPVAGSARVIHPFSAPLSIYGAGHRGVDLATGPGTPVLAAGPGIVTFAGSVAGRGVVVTRHPDGVLTEYEPVQPSVAAGTSVPLGAILGAVAGRHGDCPDGGCLHWGARRGDIYFDPMTLLAPLGPVRLIPLP